MQLKVKCVCVCVCVCVCIRARARVCVCQVALKLHFNVIMEAEYVCAFAEGDADKPRKLEYFRNARVLNPLSTNPIK